MQKNRYILGITIALLLLCSMPVWATDTWTDTYTEKMYDAYKARIQKSENVTAEAVPLGSYSGYFGEHKDQMYIVSLFEQSPGSGYYYGLMDISTGKMVVPFEYDVLYFIPGDKVFAASYEDPSSPITGGNKYYEIDYSGNIKPVLIEDFVSGVDRDGYVTLSRPVIVDYLTTQAPVDDGKNGTFYKQALLNDRYEQVLDFIAESPWPTPIVFRDDMAVIKTGSTSWTGDWRSIDGNGKYGVIDRQGKWVIEPKYGVLSYLGYGKFAVSADPMKEDSYVINAKEKKLPYAAYSAEYGKDGREPSSWSKAHIDKAVEVGILDKTDPYFYDKRYTWNASRQEFCELVVNLLATVKDEQALSKTGEQGEQTLLKTGGQSEQGTQNVFTDTKNEAVLTAYALGIVNGRGQGIFDPFADITRQEAAVMLTRTAALLGLEKNADPLIFDDLDGYSDEAASFVYDISAIQNTQTGERIMNGTGNNKFEPRKPFTTEQAVTTMVNLYNSYGSM